MAIGIARIVLDLQSTPHPLCAFHLSCIMWIVFKEIHQRLFIGQINCLEIDLGEDCMYT